LGKIPYPTKPVFEDHHFTKSLSPHVKTFSSAHTRYLPPFSIPQTPISMHPCPGHSNPATNAMVEMEEVNGCIDEIPPSEFQKF
jgi:hypothetical protein